MSPRHNVCTPDESCPKSWRISSAPDTPGPLLMSLEAQEVGAGQFQSCHVVGELPTAAGMSQAWDTFLHSSPHPLVQERPPPQSVLRQNQPLHPWEDCTPEVDITRRAVTKIKCHTWLKCTQKLIKCHLVSYDPGRACDEENRPTGLRDAGPAELVWPLGMSGPHGAPALGNTGLGGRVGTGPTAPPGNGCAPTLRPWGTLARWVNRSHRSHQTSPHRPLTLSPRPVGTKTHQADRQDDTDGDKTGGARARHRSRWAGVGGSRVTAGNTERKRPAAAPGKGAQGPGGSQSLNLCWAPRSFLHH